MHRTGCLNAPKMFAPKIGQHPRDVRASAESIGRSNVVVGPTSNVRELASAGVGLTRRQQLELEVRGLLEVEDGWWKQEGCTDNVLTATSPQHFKSIVLDAPATSIVVAYFFGPQCNACRTLWPKLTKIAANNQDVTFIKINTMEKKLVDLADGLRVSKLPWFLIFEAKTGKQVASFTANVTSVSTLRAEIAGAKACTSPQCAEV